ncbi:MAG: bifunctional ornithine acetyltransferase/N-acetylglutamate synthase, partial [Rubrivivax sp.]|nr:bifunctional ornithine acetyltransferase/N-acetylglutamate synthase [Rubrivivax sp.]
MPVNLTALDPALLNAVPGLRIATVMAGVRKTNRRDLVLFALEEGAAVAGVFTTNRFCAAPVQICQRQLAAGHAVRALLVNTGNANAGTGADGLARAERSCSALAAQLGLHAQQVLPFSTGVIMETLPVERIEAALPALVAALRPADGAAWA